MERAASGADSISEDLLLDADRASARTQTQTQTQAADADTREAEFGAGAPVKQFAGGERNAGSVAVALALSTESSQQTQYSVGQLGAF